MLNGQLNRMSGVILLMHLPAQGWRLMPNRPKTASGEDLPKNKSNLIFRASSSQNNYQEVAIKLVPAISNRPAATRDTATGESFRG